ncbi:hypothetical protein AYI83_19150 [Shewanella algae]|uniref:LysR family transcriptional regulator n=1 Tax=Shewanella algae TaxID=38313 RepID=UPI001183C8B9|nr:LysR family transcriptional regulator [Shewanella algae]TVK92531.1 hypothetical protein AYI83_19150 [Shewanella algae]UZD58912.1 LysR family transcriptional regulator [Shewanella algae]
MSTIDSYEEIIIFALICQTLSITETAKEIGKSKAHVSRQVSNLEKRIGTNLLIRSSRQLSLTDAGFALQEEAQNLLNLSRIVRSKALSLSNELCGKFSITIPTSIASSFFPKVLLKLQKTFTGIDFEIITSNAIEKINIKNIDIAIRIGTPLEDNLVVIKLGKYKDILVSSKEYHLNKNLLENCFIVNKFYLRMKREFTIDNRPFSTSECKSIIYVNDTATQLNIIKSGLGVGLVPSFAFNHHSRDLKIVSNNVESEDLGISLVYPYHRNKSDKLVKVSEMLTSEMSAYLLPTNYLLNSSEPKRKNHEEL